MLSGPALSAFLVCLAGCKVATASAPTPDELHWWKGNTHAHTLWSDGTSAPEQAALWYREHGYNFVVLSEHDQLMRGDRWLPVAADGKAPITPLAVERMVAGFGADKVAQREKGGERQMRLATLDELRARFESPDHFLMLPGEEITASYGFTPVHVNGVNLAEAIAPIHALDLQATLNHNVQAVLDQSARLKRPMLATINHPNYKWSLSWENIASAPAGAVFEVYNGHPDAQNHGNADHIGTEAIWDRALTERLARKGGDLLYAVASDDAHNFPPDPAGANTPGRGWVFVRAAKLTPAAIVTAIAHGDFYASSGVTLANVMADGRRYRVELPSEPGVEFTTRFIGTRRVGGSLGVIGEVLFETHSNPAEYVFRGNELYVRAVVTSTRAHPNPQAPGDFEMAWLQPVRPVLATARP